MSFRIVGSGAAGCAAWISLVAGCGITGDAGGAFRRRVGFRLGHFSRSKRNDRQNFVLF